ncbi:MAG: PilZ domain-containing protein [bacterium]|nr:PilZ domain-containing protein [bacterium]
MNDSSERRQFTRFRIPVIIEAGDISPIPLIPEDISAGGFKILVSTEVRPQENVDSIIQIRDEIFENCKGSIIWVREHSKEPPSWAIGFRVEDVGGEETRFEEALKSLSDLLGPENTIVPEF